MSKKLDALRSFALMLGVAIVLGSGVQASSPLPKPERVTIHAKHFFMPPGFDDNDNAQLVLSGMLPNTCYKSANPKVEIDEARKRIIVTPQAFFYPGCWCLQVLVPFTQTIDLGVLQQGNYTVTEMDERGSGLTRGTLPIAEARSGAPDDSLYAPIKAARIERRENELTLILSGQLSSCMSFKEVKVMARVPNLIEVLPIAQEDGTQCSGPARSFERSVALPALEHGTTLIHIRSLNGQSINLIEEL
jgi:hypothetical protein